MAKSHNDHNVAARLCHSVLQVESRYNDLLVALEEPCALHFEDPTAVQKVDIFLSNRIAAARTTCWMTTIQGLLAQ